MVPDWLLIHPELAGKLPQWPQTKDSAATMPNRELDWFP